MNSILIFFVVFGVFVTAFGLLSVAVAYFEHKYRNHEK